MPMTAIVNPVSIGIIVVTSAISSFILDENAGVKYAAKQLAAMQNDI
jgi:hypothetical protein